MQRRGIKHLICATFMIGMAGSVWASVGPGLYIGFGLGPATNSGSDQNVLVANPPGPPGAKTKAKPKSSQFGTQLFVGYKINQYAGFEGGFDFFSKIKYTSKVPTQSGTSARLRSINLMGKGTMPLGQFDASVKAGVAVTYLTFSGALSSSGKNQYKTKYSPTFGIGAGYALNQNWVTELTWNRILVSSVISNMDFFALSLSYHFVDRYCGQFLCDD